MRVFSSVRTFMVLGTNVEPHRPIDGMDTKVASSGVQTVTLFGAAPQGTTVYKVQVDSFEDIPGSELVGLKLVGPDEHLFQLSNNTVEVRTVAKHMFLYSALSSPGDCSNRSPALYLNSNNGSLGYDIFYR